MTGPPTPPPSSATEIVDATRTSIPPPSAPPVADTAPETAMPPMQTEQPAPAPAPPAPVSERTQTPYDPLSSQIAELTTKGEYLEVIQVAERGDMIPGYDHTMSRLLIVAPLVLAYLTVNDLAAARHALARLPKILRDVPISSRLSDLLSATWNRDYSAVYARADDVLRLCQEPASEHPEFASVIEKLVNAFLEAFRQRVFALLGKAYTSISASLAQTYLGHSVDILNIAAASGWSYDAATEVLIPPPPSVRPNGSALGSSDLQTFTTVVASLARV